MNWIKNSFLIIAVMWIVGCASNGIFAQTPASDFSEKSYMSLETTPSSANKSLLGLFYGMEKNSLGNFYCYELDSVNGLIHKEYAAEWKLSDGSRCFNMSIGLYIDSAFPSHTVNKIMLEKVDSVMPEGMWYDLDEDELTNLQSQDIAIPESVSEFLQLWQVNFDRLTQAYNARTSNHEYQKIPDARGCVVCHKIYEDNAKVTYILESSVDYHYSSGCPSNADYFTIDKKTGAILSKNDVMDYPRLEEVESRLAMAYTKAAEEKGSTPNNLWDGKELLKKANGVALINEGLLVYFKPYTIGGGGEGQYNLIVPIID